MRSLVLATLVASSAFACSSASRNTGASSLDSTRSQSAAAAPAKTWAYKLAYLGFTQEGKVALGTDRKIALSLKNLPNGVKSQMVISLTGPTGQAFIGHINALSLSSTADKRKVNLEKTDLSTAQSYCGGGNRGNDNDNDNDRFDDDNNDPFRNSGLNRGLGRLGSLDATVTVTTGAGSTAKASDSSAGSTATDASSTNASSDSTTDDSSDDDSSNTLDQAPPKSGSGAMSLTLSVPK